MVHSTFIVKEVWEKEGLRMQLKSAPVTGIDIKLFHSSDINWVSITFWNELSIKSDKGDGTGGQGHSGKAVLMILSELS